MTIWLSSVYAATINAQPASVRISVLVVMLPSRGWPIPLTTFANVTLCSGMMGPSRIARPASPLAILALISPIVPPAMSPGTDF